MNPSPGDEEPFRWLSRDGEWSEPRNMDTDHLFFTIRVIWNHTMPYEARTHDFQRRDFGPTHGPEYLVKAIGVMVPELSIRTDLGPRHKLHLRKMVEWLINNRQT